MQAKFQDQVSDLDQSWNENTLTFGFKTFGIKIAGEMTVRGRGLESHRRPSLCRSDVQGQDRIRDEGTTRADYELVASC